MFLFFFFFLLTRFLERRLRLTQDYKRNYEQEFLVLKLTKYFWALTLKHSNDNTKCYEVIIFFLCSPPPLLPAPPTILIHPSLTPVILSHHILLLSLNHSSTSHRHVHTTFSPHIRLSNTRPCTQRQPILPLICSQCRFIPTSLQPIQVIPTPIRPSIHSIFKTFPHLNTHNTT